MSNSDKMQNLAEERRLLDRVEGLVKNPASRLWSVALPVHEVLISTKYKPTLRHIHLLLLRTVAAYEELSMNEISSLVGIDHSALSVAFSALERSWKLVSVEGESIRVTRQGLKVIANDGQMSEHEKAFVFRFDGLTGYPCKRVFYDPYISRRRAGFSFARVPAIKNPDLEEMIKLIDTDERTRSKYKIPGGVVGVNEVLALIETVWVPVMVIEGMSQQFAAVLPQASHFLSKDHPLVLDPASCGCELNMERQLSSLQQELEMRLMSDAVVRLGTTEQPSLDVDPKWLRDKATGRSVNRMWFPKSGLVLPLNAREAGY